MAGGGCASQADEPDTSQYTVEEMRAIVHEAESANKKVLAHCYSNRSMRMAAKAGVYSIERRNFLNAETARFLKEKDCWIVPTLSTYFYMCDHGKELGIAGYFLRKMRTVCENALEAVHLAMEAGLKIGSGSDVIGSGQGYKNLEIGLKARVMGLDRKIGTLEAGKIADLVLVAGSPLKDTEAFAVRDNIKMIVQGGRIYKDIP